MTIIDSSVWVAWFDKDDSQHAQAEKIFEQEHAFAVPEYVVSEVCTVLSRKKGHAYAEKFLTLMLDNADITILFSSKELFHETIESFRVVCRRRLSFVDSILTVLSRSYAILTFDRVLQKVIRGGFA